MTRDDQLVLAIDQGTTSSRAVLVDRQGQIVDAVQHEFTQYFPEPGWVNHDANEIWQVTRDVIRKLLERQGAAAARIAAIGITNQRETTVIWDRRTGQPVAPAIVWQSRQTADLVQAIRDRGMEARYQAITGLVPDAYFSATKIAWLLDRDSSLRERARAGDLAAGTIDSWLIWNLTGGARHVTDVANASRTMLFDIRKLEWSDELLADLDVPRELLPEICSNSEIIAESTSEAIGIVRPISGVAGDQHAALFGQACFAPGEAKNTYGTGSFLLMQTGTQAIESRHRLLTTVAWQIGDTVEYALEGAVFVSGSAVQWLRDGLGLIRNASEIEALAASVPSTEGLYFVPALTGLGAPHWDADARGTITGITRGTTAAHLARATLEAIAFQARDVLDAMRADSGIELAELRVDGGASANDVLMQIQADVLGVPVVRPRQVETTVLGAAYLAGLATGVWSDREDVRTSWQVDATFEPEWSSSERESRLAGWHHAVRQARA